jgi:hypothetical protein
MANDLHFPEKIQFFGGYFPGPIDLGNARGFGEWHFSQRPPTQKVHTPEYDVPVHGSTN